MLVGVFFFAGASALARHLSPVTSRLSTADAMLAVLVLTLFVLNGISPYLGLKTEFSFAMFSNLRDDPWRHLLIADRWRPFRASHYVRISDVRGLPEAVSGDGAYALVVHLLSQSDRYRYSPYLLREGVHLLLKRPAPDLALTVHDNGREVPFTEWGGSATRFGNLPLVLFPFVMPLDEETTHSEQGSVPGSSERQLF